MTKWTHLGTIALAAATLLAAVPAFVSSDEAASESRFLTQVRQLTFQGRRSGESYFSPDGNHLIFQGERDKENPFDQIHMLDLSSGDAHRVSPGSGKTTCAFFRPGTDDVLFASTHHDPEARAKQKAEIEFRASGKERRYSWDYDETFDIFAARRDGSELRRLTDARGYDAEAAYSPDGSQIVFCSLRNAYTARKLSEEDSKRLEYDAAYFGEIYMMDADGSNARRLTDWPGYDGGPFFTPDGKRIIWRHFNESGMIADVYTMSLDGGDRQRMTDFGSMSWAPYFHPSGRYVIFTSNKLGFSNFELYIVDAAGRKEPVRVTRTDGFDGLPVFSPDGARLAWTSNRTPSGKTQIFMAQWNHAAALEALQEAPSRSGGPVASPEITAADLRADATYLSSDELGGRMTGTEGTSLAAEHIVKRLAAAGVQPLGEDATYLHGFPFTSGVRLLDEGNSLKVTVGSNTETYKLGRDFHPLGFSTSETVDGEVVFAGYGLVAPGDLERGYDSYSNLDVTDKIVLVLRYAPEDVETKRRQELNHYAGLRYKAMLARERGAKGLLVVVGPNSPNAGELMSLKFDQNLQSSGIAVASVTGKVAESMFAAAGKNLKEVQSRLDLEDPHFEAHFALTGVATRLSCALKTEKKTGHNVIGVLSPTDDTRDAEYIVIGAHYDHIGRGEIGSLARKGEEGQIHNGADDNASGTSVVLELAAALANEKRRNPEHFKRGIIFALWSGEELGIIGSSYFVSDPPVAIERIAAYLNFDMVGRLRDNKLLVQGTGSSDAWTRLVEKRNVAAGFSVNLQEDPYLPTDVTAFYPKGVPVLSFFTGSHEDYNRPTDDAETLNYEGMERIGRFAHGIIDDLLDSEDRPRYVKVEPSKGQTGDRASLRAYLGTIPDYAGDDVEGVKLSGVRSGGPADKAGLLGGDIIVEFGGQKIANIYDYTYALDAVKIGKPVQVVVLRDAKRVTLSIIPEARE